MSKPLYLTVVIAALLSGCKAGTGGAGGDEDQRTQSDAAASSSSSSSSSSSGADNQIPQALSLYKGLPSYSALSSERELDAPVAIY